VPLIECIFQRYLTSTIDVKKVVMVLIDNGSSMAKIIVTIRSDSNLVVAFKVIESFLNTTTKDDYVNIFTFDTKNVNFSSVQLVSHNILEILRAKKNFYYIWSASVVVVEESKNT